ncbi:MAG: hypothetical protein IPJ61_16645 [Tessaracoccus sp.]|uniref:hypothetical protein n=1 Tax=Tessaracoccus sp. TaxID=1971211 RepID=UPI001EB44070|nr:hypothetical protein [Tessaracoccus sp.]MBK7822640.1 hypothetical protein [Tessaracoccus sp.]
MSLLVLLFAVIPITEMLAVRLFSGIITDGPGQFAANPLRVVWQIVVFFLALAVTRSAHHLIKIVRVRVFRSGFQAAGSGVPPNKESWQWAVAFEMSNVSSAVVQIAMFAALFFAFDPITGIVGAVVAAASLAAISWLYQRQLRLQRDYLETRWTPEAVAIPDRVGTRIKHSEIGAFVGTAGLLVTLIVVFARVLGGQIVTSDAIVLFLGLRLMFGQFGTLSSGAMRFARAAVHL